MNDDGWLPPPDDEWLFEPEYEPPPVPWWQEPGAIRAATAGACVIVLGIVALFMLTDGDAGSTEDRLPVILPISTTSSAPPPVTVASTTTTTTRARDSRYR